MQAGFTLIELLVASTMMIAILGGAITLLITALKDEPKISGRAEAVGEARTAIDGIVRDLRQGTEVITKEKSKIVFKTYLHANPCSATPSASTAAIECRVTYSCSTTTKACTRKPESAAGGSPGTTTTVITGISNAAEVFCYMPSETASLCGTSVGAPTYVGVKIVLPNESGSGTTTLEEGAALRDTTTNLAN
jgi:type II secretory pathway pseudopilin PulG